MSKIRDLALALLDTEHGISGDAYGLLRELMLEAGDCDDVVAVKATDDAFYVPES